MARQAPFTEYEAVLLLDAFLQAELGAISRKEAIKNCSAALRSMALSNGIEIDSTYRNINGITFQMASMESAYRGKTIRMPATRFFEKTVEMYKTNREEYERILKEAKLMSENNNESDRTYMPDKEKLIDIKSSVPMVWKQMMLDVEPYVPMEKEQTMPDIKLYRIVLEKYFLKGYRLNSSIEMKKFRRYYEEANGTELKPDNEAVEAAIRQSGIEHEGRVYAPRIMMDSDLNDRLFEYVEKCFSKGKKALYFEAVFREFSERFLDCNIYDAAMLKAYIAYMTGNKYFIGKSYLSNEQGAVGDPIEDIKTCLKECSMPMKTEDLCQTLSHIPEKRIRLLLGTNHEFVNNGKGEYFHADSFALSDEELENISALINAEINLREYISGNELYDAIKAKYPHIYERNMIFSALGWRDALKYKLGEQYSFAGNIISAKGKSLSMSNVFSNYAKERGEFTLQELLTFAENIGSTVYFDALYKNAVRVSQEQFVGKDSVSFNVKDTDRILNQFCTSAYCAITDVKDFGIFPEASHPWTIFFLESYLAHYSERYCLMHNGYGQNVAVGAMVKRDRQYADFDELVTDILAECGAELQKKDALDYLYDNGYIARRSYNNIESILINARAKRNKKEK